LGKYVVLWVDDYIFHEHWDNRRYMEKASTLGAGKNVHFIPKSNTESALVFLRSAFGQRLKQNKTFRIVTDMNRENEDSSNTAGARLIYEVRKLGFNHTCLIFTTNNKVSKEKINKVFPDLKPSGIIITDRESDLEEFVLFKQP
jgi:hypothetical protein